MSVVGGRVKSRYSRMIRLQCTILFSKMPGELDIEKPLVIPYKESEAIVHLCTIHALFFTRDEGVYLFLSWRYGLSVVDQSIEQLNTKLSRQKRVRGSFYHARV